MINFWVDTLVQTILIATFVFSLMAGKLISYDLHIMAFYIPIVLGGWQLISAAIQWSRKTIPGLIRKGLILYSAGVFFFFVFFAAEIKTNNLILGQFIVVLAVLLGIFYCVLSWYQLLSGKKIAKHES